jgi:hypothetical protein
MIKCINKTPKLAYSATTSVTPEIKSFLNIAARIMKKLEIDEAKMKKDKSKTETE